MAWYDFADWGGTPAYEDIDDAQAQLEEWMSRTPWPASASQVVVNGGLSVKQDLEGWFGVDIGSAADYWTTVANQAANWVTAAGYNTNDLTNWGKWQGVFNGAAETAVSYEEGRELGSLPRVLVDTGKETLEDLKDQSPTTPGSVAREVMGWAFKGAAVGVVFNAGNALYKKAGPTPDQLLMGALYGGVTGGLWGFYQSTGKEDQAEA